MFVYMIVALVVDQAKSSHSLFCRIVGRAIAGVGATGITTGSFTIIAFTAEPKKRPLFIGIPAVSYGIACVIGPVLGGAFSGR